MVKGKNNPKDLKLQWVYNVESTESTEQVGRIRSESSRSNTMISV